MYFDNIYSNNKLDNQTINSIILSENRVVTTESKTTRPTPTTPNEINSNISAFFWGATVLSIISLVLLKVFHKLETVKIRGSSIWPVSQIPCKSCQFFAQNRYLSCAVHPFTVLTKQAKNWVLSQEISSLQHYFL